VAVVIITGTQLKVYGGVPPVGVAVAVPSQEELHVTFVPETLIPI